MSTSFDEGTVASWRSFEQRLGRALDQMGTSWFEIGLPAGNDEDLGAAVLLESADDRVMALLCGAPVRAHAALAALGWQPPDPADDVPAMWRSCVPVGQEEVLVGMVSGTLRHVFGVVDPTALTDTMAGPSPGGGAPGPQDVATLVESPGCPEELQALVDRTLTAHLGHAVQHDADGDVPVTNGTVPVWVQVSTRAPRVRLFSHVVCDVRRTRQARIEMDVLNRRTADICFYLDEDTVVAEAYVQARPFAAQHLTDLLDHMLETLDDLAGDFAARVEGRTFFDGLVPPSTEESR